MTARVGAAVYPYHGTGYEQLVNQADIAMYPTKARSGSGPPAIEALLRLQRRLAEQVRSQPPERNRGPIDADSGAAGRVPSTVPVQLDSP